MGCWRSFLWSHHHPICGLRVRERGTSSLCGMAPQPLPACLNLPSCCCLLPLLSGLYHYPSCHWHRLRAIYRAGAERGGRTGSSERVSDLLKETQPAKGRTNTIPGTLGRLLGVKPPSSSSSFSSSSSVSSLVLSDFSWCLRGPRGDEELKGPCLFLLFAWSPQASSAYSTSPLGPHISFQPRAPLLPTKPPF